MVDKSTDHGKLLPICFYNNIDSRYPFPFKFLVKSRAREKNRKKTELAHHHVISTVCIEHSSPPISAREIAHLFKKKERFFEQPRSQGPSASRRSRRQEGERSGKEVVLGDLNKHISTKCNHERLCKYESEYCYLLGIKYGNK